jgi:predicted N-acetyltransferase YhbS
MPDIPIHLDPERPEDAPAIERLHERAFGPGRFARTAFRLREGVPARLPLSFVARIGSMIVGSNRMTEIRVGSEPALLLGPLTVEPAFQSLRIGMTLMEASIEAARGEGHSFVLLVGDEPYYARIGFRRVPPGRITLPGPVDSGRLLCLELSEGALARMEGMANGLA